MVLTSPISSSNGSPELKGYWLGIGPSVEQLKSRGEEVDWKISDPHETAH